MSAATLDRAGEELEDRREGQREADEDLVGLGSTTTTRCGWLRGARRAFAAAAPPMPPPRTRTVAVVGLLLQARR